MLVRIRGYENVQIISHECYQINYFTDMNIMVFMNLFCIAGSGSVQCEQCGSGSVGLKIRVRTTALLLQSIYICKKYSQG